MGKHVIVQFHELASWDWTDPFSSSETAHCYSLYHPATLLGRISVQLTSIYNHLDKVISSTTLATFLSDSWSWRMGSIDLHLSSVIQMAEMPFWPINIHDTASLSGLRLIKDLTLFRVQPVCAWGQARCHHFEVTDPRSKGAWRAVMQLVGLLRKCCEDPRILTQLLMWVPPQGC